jgi:hypothetical protein
MSRKLLDLWVGIFVAMGLAGILFPGAEGRQSSRLAISPKHTR